MADQSTLDAFRKLFRGRDDVWGGIQGLCNKEPVTEKNYEQHLNGKTSLGVYPLLDDGTCYFFAIDLDEKNFTKAKAIREQYWNAGLPVYISQSRSKGYHVYGFAEDHFVAKEVRSIAHRVLTKLGISCEVFPKQDMLDDTIKFGNYINLPCFGDRRHFVDTKHKDLPTKESLSKIKLISASDLQVADGLLPEVKPLAMPLVPAPKAPARQTKGNSKKTNAPPCVEGILKQGTQQGARDEAAFALARHYLDQGYLPEEVMALLNVWDQNNKPPLNDQHLFETKIRSAQSGYAFGCASITKGLLSGYCVGEQNCQWLKSSEKDRRKKGQIRDTSTYEDEAMLWEQIMDNGQPMFMGIDKKTGDIKKAAAIEVGEVTLKPMYTPEVTEEAVIFPTGIEEYGSTEDLVQKIKEFILIYADIPDRFLEFAAWYVLMSWVYDKLRTVSYLRFRGDTGTGKSRCLDVVGNLCYKPMIVSGAITPAPIYRIIKKFRGTLILDEADFNDSSEKSEVITILNCGFEKGRPIIRCTKDDPDSLQVFPCFGPKVFATRESFQDKALEARCLTHITEETERDDIPPVLGEAHKQREMGIRNMLLLWRFRNQPRIDPRGIEDIDLGRIEPRLKQTGLPFALTFKDMPEVMQRFKDFIADYNADLIRERADSAQGRLVYAMFSCAAESGKNYVTARMVADKATEEYKLDLKPTKVGQMLKSLNVQTDKTRVAGKQGRYIVWNDKTMRSLRRRFMTSVDDFSNLFDTPYEGPIQDLFGGQAL